MRKYTKVVSRKVAYYVRNDRLPDKMDEMYLLQVSDIALCLKTGNLLKNRPGLETVLDTYFDNVG